MTIQDVSFEYDLGGIPLTVDVELTADTRHPNDPNCKSEIHKLSVETADGEPFWYEDYAVSKPGCYIGGKWNQCGTHWEPLQKILETKAMELAE